MPNKQFLLRIPIYFCFLILGLTLLPTTTNAGTACVWRVVNAKAPFYLVGTIHALSGNDYPLPKPYDQALKDSKVLLFEIDPHPSNDWSDQYIKATKYPKGDKLQRHVHPKTWDYLVKNFRISNYPMEWLEEHRPWAVASIWGIHGFNDVFDQHGVDNHLAYQAMRMGKQVGGLETGLEHIEVLRGMSDIDSELTLLDTMVRGDKRRDDYNALRAAWKHGDLGPILADEERSRKLNLGGELRLLDYRNLRWMKKIVGQIESGQPTSIVAGVDHFVGPNSVVELLQKRGYTVEQL